MTQLTNQHGQTIGYFLTVEEHEHFKRMEEEYRRMMYEWARRTVTDEELDAAEADPVELTTEEVLRGLKEK